ncbi:Methanogenic corrinoid protein MtbC1 [Mesobacillus persicus]|uniref:Methanogenic corrinoid protein MtbC1 n=1 Tax=Mesobacillus persicus TaxID=930146 RepID=A0A1H8DGQ5_9BACI|nr:cobalamin-dependent protein [Mesobacillus persicus]SEN06502.1 Methanogenic corrinoid protein MtbC1 [Mesobacillus persicus]
MNSQIYTFTDHLLGGNQDKAWEMLLSEVGKGKSSLDIYQNLVTNSLIYIGKLWEENKIKVADEHLASATCDFLLTRYFFHKQQMRKTAPIQKKAMFFCLEEEQHFLGIKMVSLLFQEDGWETRFLGQNLPLEYVTNMARKWKPDLIGMSFTTLYAANQVSDYINSLEQLEHRPEVLLGGRLVSKSPFNQFATDATTVIEELAGLQKWLPLACGEGNHV